MTRQCLLIGVLLTMSMSSSAGESLLWYKQAADRWPEALPIGNGSQGGMIYGGVKTDRIDLTDVTFFSGELGDHLQAGAHDHLQPIRAALLKQDYETAEKEIAGFLGKRENYGTNLPLAILELCFNHDAEVHSYRRSLNIEEAEAEVTYKSGGGEFRREYFASHPDQVLVIRLTASKPGDLSFAVKLSGDHESFQCQTVGNDLLLMGYAYESKHSDGQTGVMGAVRLAVDAPRASVQTDTKGITVSKATQVTLTIAMGTSFKGQDALALCEQRLTKVRGRSYDQLRTSHVQDYQQLFKRLQFTLAADDKAKIPTDERRKALSEGQSDVGLIPLMYQYARYLTIASSRADSPLPSHLQGVWNDNEACRIGWTCDMHLDINTQMNYWLTETTNLTECGSPLFAWIENTLMPSGQKTAQELYQAPGWVAHIVSNAWGFTAPGWSSYWGLHTTGGAWVTTHLWDHYQYTRDIDFLREHTYPVLKGCAEFFLGTLFKDPATGYWVTGPSISPENRFTYKGKGYTNDIMPTCDRVLINEIFNACIQAAEILERDEDLVTKIKTYQTDLPPFKINSRGRLQEWYHDHEEGIPQHRHMTHLLSVFPFAQIKPETDPQLSAAAWQSMLGRCLPAETWEDTGWARSLLILNSARLWQTDDAYQHVLAMQRLITEDNLMVFHPAGAGAHGPVWELDGNTGLCMGVTEMLMQSHFAAGEIKGQTLDCETSVPVIHLLPALPQAWATGAIKGLKARGDFTVSMEWQDGKLNSATLESARGGDCVLRYGQEFQVVKLNPGGSFQWKP